MIRRLPVANALFVMCAIAGFLSACSGSSTTPSHPFCPVSKPFVELLYPIPGSTGVSANVGQMVFASNGITRIRLEIGPYPFSGTLRTKAEPVPNPLPTPIATAGPYAQYLTTRFAVSFVTLQPHTQYNAQAYVVPNPCSGGEPFPPGWSNIDSFTTQ
jgi:hypothetical protein